MSSEIRLSDLKVCGGWMEWDEFREMRRVPPAYEGHQVLVWRHSKGQRLPPRRGLHGRIRHVPEMQEGRTGDRARMGWRGGA